MLDLRHDPVVIHYPAFSSKFVSLETSALDHYNNIPLATSKCDFKKPTTLLFYSARTEGYSGESVPGVYKITESPGDFAGAFLRVMPEVAGLGKFKANMAALHKVGLHPLPEFQAPYHINNRCFKTSSTLRRSWMIPKIKMQDSTTW